jgi:hypothetical protein
MVDGTARVGVPLNAGRDGARRGGQAVSLPVNYLGLTSNGYHSMNDRSEIGVAATTPSWTRICGMRLANCDRRLAAAHS